MTATRVSHFSDPRQIAEGINKALRRTDNFGQAAIADDASGAANQAKVNAILAALRAAGIIDT